MTPGAARRPAGGLTATTPFGYAGGYTDPDELIYLLDRYYDPQTGQFLSVDPDLAQTQEPYAYGGGDPVINSDSTGDDWVFLGWTHGQRGWFPTGYNGPFGWLIHWWVRNLAISLDLGIFSVTASPQVAFTWWIAWYQWYDGRIPTPWVFAYFWVWAWVRAHVTIAIGVKIPIIGITIGKTVWEGETPTLLAGACTGYVMLHKGLVAYGGGCGLF
jgi:RHS repeat-associated protein